MLYSSVYNLFALIGRRAPFTHSLKTSRQKSKIDKQDKNQPKLETFAQSNKTEEKVTI